MVPAAISLACNCFQPCLRSGNVKSKDSLQSGSISITSICVSVSYHHFYTLLSCGFTFSSCIFPRFLILNNFCGKPLSVVNASIQIVGKFEHSLNYANSLQWNPWRNVTLMGRGLSSLFPDGLRKTRAFTKGSMSLRDLHESKKVSPS